MSFASKTVVVTGSSDNIGRAIALKFAAAGANVVTHAKSNVSGGERVKREAEQAGAKAIFLKADLALESDVRALFERTVAEFGGVDVLVNNAGRFEEGAFRSSTNDHWERMFKDNLFSAVNCCVEASRVMGAGGRIVNVASIRGLERGGRPGGIAYSAAKAAVINFTKTLSQELAPNILVNAVAPGFTKTTAFDHLPPEVINSFLDTTLLKAWVSPEEIAEAVYYLASSRSITGEILVVDAGWNAK